MDYLLVAVLNSLSKYFTFDFSPSKHRRLHGDESREQSIGSTRVSSLVVVMVVRAIVRQTVSNDFTFLAIVHQTVSNDFTFFGLFGRISSVFVDSGVIDVDTERLSCVESKIATGWFSH